MAAAPHPERVCPAGVPRWGWLAVQLPGRDLVVHAVPTWDVRQHEFSLECACGPVEDADGDPVVVHNAFDGRERFEEPSRRH